MAPCLRLYAYLACQMAAAYPFADHEYTGAVWHCLIHVMVLQLYCLLLWRRVHGLSVGAWLVG